MTREELLHYVTTMKRFGNLKSMLKTNNPALLQDINNAWKLDRPPVTISEAIYQYFNPTNVICPYGNEKRFKSYRVGYVCKKDCKCSKEKQANTMMERYGVAHALQSKELLNKAQDTWEKKYDTRNLSHINLDKKRETNIERYGAPTPFESTEVLQKIKETNLERYGVETPMHSAEVQQKVRDTVNQKYGVNSILALTGKKYKNLVVTENSSEVERNAKKLSNTIFSSIYKKYGSTHYSRRTLKQETLAEYTDDTSFAKVYDSFGTVEEVAAYFGATVAVVRNRAKTLNLPVKQTQ